MKKIIKLNQTPEDRCALHLAAGGKCYNEFASPGPIHYKIAQKQFMDAINKSYFLRAKKEH